MKSGSVRTSIRRKALLALLAMTGATSFLWAQVKSGVIGSRHDVDGYGCKSCHAPHNGSVAIAPGTDQSTGQVLLWDRDFSSLAFETYDSPTMNEKAEEVGGLLLLNTQSRVYTLLCMSCHDGVTTPDMVLSTSDKVGSLTDSYGLTNDHPVNVIWSHQTLAGGQPSCSNCHDFHGQPSALPFYSGYVQCSSCHDPHSRANENFLRISNTNSALCLFCHG